MSGQRQNYQAWGIKPIILSSVSRKEFLMHLIGWAILAPNSHNAQPWRFVLDEPSFAIQVCIDSTYVLPASDKIGRQAYISVGCALENLLFAAEAYGLRYEVEYASETLYYPDPIATVTLMSNGERRNPPDSRPFEFMKNRRMNRGTYDPSRQIPEFILNEILGITESLGLSLNILTDVLTRSAIAEVQYQADRAVVMRGDFRNELARFFLPNDTELPRGMPGNTFGLNDVMAARIHEELKKSGPFDPDIAYGFAASGRDGLRSSPAVLVVSVPEDVPEWWVKTGRALERIAFIAERHTLSMAIHAALIEVEVFNKLLKARLRQRNRPTVIMRIGYATEERPHSPRTTIDEVLMHPE
jgi:nitroreductase